jgi:hypothetical protein
MSLLYTPILSSALLHCPIGLITTLSTLFCPPSLSLSSESEQRIVQKCSVRCLCFNLPLGLKTRQFIKSLLYMYIYRRIVSYKTRIQYGRHRCWKAKITYEISKCSRNDIDEQICVVRHNGLFLCAFECYNHPLAINTLARTRRVGPSTTLAWPGWKQLDIPKWKWTRHDSKIAVLTRWRDCRVILYRTVHLGVTFFEGGLSAGME